MIYVPCPECGTKIAGNARGCACGWGGGRKAYASSFDDEFTQERKRKIAETELQKSVDARLWLERHGIYKAGMTRKEKTAADLAYMRRLKTLPKVESHNWAYEIISRLADGESVTAHAEALAREVTKIPREHRDAA